MQFFVEISDKCMQTIVELNYMRLFFHEVSLKAGRSILKIKQ